VLCGAGFSTAKGAKYAKNLLNTKLFTVPNKGKIPKITYMIPVKKQAYFA
jgi:hypothetical protein